jgi:osmotically inducible protein OsmC
VPRIVRVAEVAWEGSLSRGSGIATATTSNAFALPVDLPSRIDDKPGKTSPEELLAAAHAACFTTSLAGEIARAGGTVERLDVTCAITIDEVAGEGHRVVASGLEARAAAAIDDEAFERAVAAADAGCTFSALLRGSASVSVRAELESNEGGEQGGG